MVATLKRFWWVLVLVALFVFFWLRNKLREAERAAVVEKQLDVEREFRSKIATSETLSRQERTEYKAKVEETRHETEERKAEFDRAISADADALADAWNRAFGKR